MGARIKPKDRAWSTGESAPWGDLMRGACISKSGKFRFGHVAPTDLSQPFDGLTTARSYM